MKVSPQPDKVITVLILEIEVLRFVQGHADKKRQLSRVELITPLQVASFLRQLIEIPPFIMEAGGGVLKQQRADLKNVVIRFKSRMSFFAFSSSQIKGENQTFQ